MIKYKLIVVFVTILFVVNVSAQNPIELFCKISISQAKHGIDLINIDYGAIDNFKIIKDSFIIINLRKVNLLNNQIDAFNYMSSLGWDCINIVSVITQNHPFPYEKFVCIFKKVFTKEDIK